MTPSKQTDIETGFLRNSKFFTSHYAFKGYNLHQGQGQAEWISRLKLNIHGYRKMLMKMEENSIKTHYVCEALCLEPSGVVRLRVERWSAWMGCKAVPCKRSKVRGGGENVNSAQAA